MVTWSAVLTRRRGEGPPSDSVVAESLMDSAEYVKQKIFPPGAVKCVLMPAHIAWMGLNCCVCEMASPPARRTRTVSFNIFISPVNHTTRSGTAG